MTWTRHLTPTLPPGSVNAPGRHEVGAPESDETPLVDISLLGGFRVVVGDAVVADDAWRRRAAAHVVKLLALKPGHTISRDQLVDCLWPDLTPADAAPRLHKAAHYARAALGRADTVVLAGEMVTLLPGGRVTVDLDLFDDAAAAAEAAHQAALGAGPEAADGAAAESRRLAALALDLYGGDLLPADLYESWTDEVRQSRRLRWLRLLRQAARWEELTQADPTDEEAHVRWAHTLARRGDRAEALVTLDRLEQTMTQELGVAPGPTVAKLREAVLAAPVPDPDTELQAPPEGGTAARGATPLPAAAARLVGRTEEIRRSLSLLDSSRILTLLGPGGVGKTTLAVEVGRRRAEATGAEACFVDLTEVDEADHVAGFVAGELGIHQSRGADPEPALAEAVRGRHLVVVLDNFEHVVDAADLVARLASWSPHLEVVSTSRARLQVTDEQVLDVPPFAVPPADDTDARLAESDAVVLFSQVARAVDPTFDPARHLEDVAAICRTVDGLPLAIKLAAGQVRTLPPPLLRTRLAARLGAPDGALRDAPTRQRTIPATIDWSLQLLGPDEVRLFTRLGVFAAPVSLEGIEQICADPGADVVPALSRLVDQSLVQRTGDGVEARFRMLELIRERSRQLLDDAPDGEAVRRRHAEYVAAVLERIEADRWDELSASWIGMVSSMLPEVRSAYSWAHRHDDHVLCARIVATLGTFWLREGHHVEGRQWVADVLSWLDELETGVAGRVLVAAALLHWTHAPAIARVHWAGAVQRFREIGDDRYLSYALGLAAGAYIGDADSYDDAVAMSREAIALGRTVGDRPLLAQSLNVFGELARNQGDDDLAEECYLEGLTLAREAGDRAHESVMLANLAYISTHRGDYAEALGLAQEALRTCWSLGLRMMTAWTLTELAGPHLGLGNHELGARLIGAGDRALATLGVGRQLGDQREHEAVVRALCDAIGDEAYARAEAEGALMTLNEAVPMALREDAEQPDVPVAE
jgi:predicted ATPase/DNA-binding SARP family transcriptional activator